MGPPLATVVPAALASPPPVPHTDVFEGPEKKLDIYFSRPTAGGLRQFDQDVWSDLLLDAKCEILHRTSNAAFDAYLLSESSMFVYTDRVILKTCGTTTLLLVLPKLLKLASQVGSAFSHLQYGHYRYKFPDQQIYPHSSFAEEERYLAGYFPTVTARVLGPAGGRQWYLLAADASASPASLPPSPPLEPLADIEPVFEVAMEGLDPSVCALFCGGSSAKPLARNMTTASGLRAFLPSVAIDDWEFEPCGYSMNGLRGSFYYTIHVTPEEAFSYASFETNDPVYREPARVAQLVAIFAPSVLTATLTSPHSAPLDLRLDDYTLPGFQRTNAALHPGSPSGKGQQRAGAVCCLNFALRSGTSESAGSSPLTIPVDADAAMPEGCGDAAYSGTLTADGVAAPLASEDDRLTVDGLLAAYSGEQQPVGGGGGGPLKAT